MQPEGKIVRKIQTYLESRGAWVAKIHGGDNPFQAVGLPDLLSCYEGRFYGLEVKQPGEKPSPIQAKVLREIREAGGVGAVVTSVAEVKNLLTYSPEWVAGFYEGEGSVGAFNPGNTWRPKLRVSITQKDPSPLKYIQGYFGGNIRRVDGGCHRLVIADQGEVMRFLETIGPLLKSEYRRNQLRAAIRKVEEATGESYSFRGDSRRTVRSSTRIKSKQ